jgi:peptidylprolyl isomerase
MVLATGRKEARMAQAQQGDKVKVHYTGRLDDGTVFDSSIISDPLEFTIGEREVITGFEEAVIGMNPGESKTIRVPVDRAYGPHREDMIMEVEREKFPPEIEPEVGQQLEIRRRENGQTFPVTVTDVSESSVTLDANHHLAGKDLTFDIQLLEIV